jgi:putative sigma-54 modulation protein
MNTQVAFRQMDTSPVLRDYATHKLEKIVDKYVHGSVDASVVMSVQKYWHIADFTLNIKNLTVKGQERSEDMYSSIDLALDKIEKQLRRHKDRIRDHKPSNGEARRFKMGVISPVDVDDDPEVDDSLAVLNTYVEETETPPVIEANETRVFRQKEFTAKSMTVEDAIVQLDILEDREFYVFTNAETNAINVVFKRRDGRVGLIET